MMKVVAPKEMARVEQLAYAAGCSEETFMEQAGAALFAHIRKVPGRPRMTLLCGSGNNGGDGYVVGRLLVEAGYELRVF